MQQSASLPLDKIDPNEAWKPWQPDEGNPWSLKWAGHLYRRAAFCPSWNELQRSLQQGYEPTIELLLNGGAGAREFDELVDDSARGLSLNQRNAQSSEHQAIWLYRMMHSPFPLRERMTLFWHNHFATSIAKVRQPDLMQKQNALLRQHCLGKFRPLLSELSRDPAMLIWLDSNSNVKGRANENYAREVMELFSLGVGNYTEKDIQEAARAFTGWHTAGGEFIYNKNLHDDGVKTVLGRRGNWDGGDIVQIILEKPAAARHLARKLYKQFVNENDPPPDRLLEPLAEQLRQTDFDIGAIVGTILRSKHFFSDYAYRQRIKSPVEYVVGLVHSLEAQVPPTSLTSSLDSMAQTLLAPPNVKGWDGGKAWLNSATILARHNTAWMIVGGESAPFTEKCNPAALTQKYGLTESTQQISFLLDLFLQGDVSKSAAPKLVDFMKAGDPQNDQRTKRIREIAHTILVLPEYQLA